MPNWLPNFQETIENSFRDYVKTPLENKANELNSKLEAKANQFQAQIDQKAREFKTSNTAFQQAIIAILFASFCVGIITITFKDNKND